MVRNPSESREIGSSSQASSDSSGRWSCWCSPESRGSASASFEEAGITPLKLGFGLAALLFFGVFCILLVGTGVLGIPLKSSGFGDLPPEFLPFCRFTVIGRHRNSFSYGFRRPHRKQDLMSHHARQANARIPLRAGLLALGAAVLAPASPSVLRSRRHSRPETSGSSSPSSAIAHRALLRLPLLRGGRAYSRWIGARFPGGLEGGGVSGPRSCPVMSKAAS